MEIVAFAVQWMVAPCIMLALFFFATAIVGAANGKEIKTSAKAGLWAGLIIFVIYVVSQLGVIRNSRFDFYELPGLLLGPIAIGVIVGFLFLWLVRIMLPTRLLGLLTLVLSATSTSALFSYLFINYLRIIVLYSMLGIALGILLHIVLFPATVRDIF